mmetsp:Transcript_85568/g.215807  ORF Transcript_85568/g.215807 Transcript_85568/m.215807 type:complete len:93 (+) Transcript_85568:549-827(+)
MPWCRRRHAAVLLAAVASLMAASSEDRMPSRVAWQAEAWPRAKADPVVSLRAASLLEVLPSVALLRVARYHAACPPAAWLRGESLRQYPLTP